MKLPENPGYGTICRGPFGTLWVRTGHDAEHPWVQVHTTVERMSDEYVQEQVWEVAWSPDAPTEPDREVSGAETAPRVADLARQLDQARGLAARLWDELTQEEAKASGTHGRDACQGSGCVVHHPSDHPMQGWPLRWRPDRRLVERTCPHGVGHPDPDDAAYRASLGDTDLVHGCDGCCRPGWVVS